MQAVVLGSSLALDSGVGIGPMVAAKLYFDHWLFFNYVISMVHIFFDLCVLICKWQTNTPRDHSVSVDSVTVILMTTTMNMTRITSMVRTRHKTQWTKTRAASCRTTPTTAGCSRSECDSCKIFDTWKYLYQLYSNIFVILCSSSIPLEGAATATFANASMDLASKTPRWSLWYMCLLESKSDDERKGRKKIMSTKSNSPFLWTPGCKSCCACWTRKDPKVPDYV